MQPPYIGHRLLHTTKFKFWYPAIMDFENDDYLDFSDDDLICTSRDAISSDDETDAQILRFPSKGVKKTQNKLTEIKKSTEDEFECEMMKELSSTMEEATSFAKSNSGTKIEKEMVKMDDKDESQCYDDVYFDSDEEDGEDQANQRRLCSNDELLYDPKMDEQDQLWVDKRRRSYQVKKKNRLNPDEPQLLPQSDAVLNCPACLTTHLCLDCQRHEKYTNQYRAMFVFNCKVDRTQLLSYPKKETKTERLQRIKQKRVTQREAMSLQNEAPAGLDAQANSAQGTSTLDSAAENEEWMDNFHPVLCNICGTKVAVYDEDEIYHFFNIVTSY
ncbi:E2F-associated phosphoprotein-like [Oratosquilla oratoria]|uniref:E2F-associated phosphoprotein-like n=1 Tax=Oratosquilla oratoria TaxID=337810 RepID=UPI003F75E9C6